MEATGVPLLLAEDDPKLTELLVELLTDEGYSVDPAPDGQAALHLAMTRRYQLAVFDRGLPGLEGVELLRRLRSRGFTTPTLVLTAWGSVADRVEGLDAGAEDYLVKPFDIEELLARLRALRRRHRDNAGWLAIGDRWLDVDGRRVVPAGDGSPIDLSARECALLRVLATRPGRVFTRQELLEAAFTSAEGHSVVDTYVHYLRRKLGRGIIATVHGTGYRIGTG